MSSLQPKLLTAVHATDLFVFYIRYQSNTSKLCLDTILSIQPKDSSVGGGETRESAVRRQAGEMLEKLPPDYIPHEVGETAQDEEPMKRVGMWH